MSPIKLQESYQSRPIRCLELWEHNGWRMKLYDIAYNRAKPRAELILIAKELAKQVLPPVDDQHYGVGYIGVHDGRGANFIFIDFWSDENELNHRVFIGASDKPTKLARATFEQPTACVWDLRVMAYEREAWMDCVLTNPKPDLEAYLRRQLSEDA
jgi:hypothetical protein